MLIKEIKSKLSEFEKQVSNVRFFYGVSYAFVDEKVHKQTYFKSYDEVVEFYKENENRFLTLRIELNYSEIIFRYDKEVKDESEQ